MYITCVQVFTGLHVHVTMYIKRLNALQQSISAIYEICAVYLVVYIVKGWRNTYISSAEHSLFFKRLMLCTLQDCSFHHRDPICNSSYTTEAWRLHNQNIQHEKKGYFFSPAWWSVVLAGKVRRNQSSKVNSPEPNPTIWESGKLFIRSCKL